jgi:hypothetical protein
MLFAWLVHSIIEHWSLLQGPAVNRVASEVGTPADGLPAWAMTQVVSLAKMTIIIMVLVLGLNLIKVLGQARLLERVLGPLLRLIGISAHAAGITMVGVLLGISYGGGLIAREAGSGAIDQRDVVYSLVLLGLIHSVIEDTALMLLIGADLFIILAGRMVYSLVLTAAFVMLTRSLSPERFERLFATRTRSTRV